MTIFCHFLSLIPKPVSKLWVFCVKSVSMETRTKPPEIKPNEDFLQRSWITMNVTCGDTVRLTNGPFLELFHLLLTLSDLIVVSIISERTILKTLSVLIQIHQLACESCFSLKHRETIRCICTTDCDLEGTRWVIYFCILGCKGPPFIMLAPRLRMGLLAVISTAVIDFQFWELIGAFGNKTEEFLTQPLLIIATYLKREEKWNILPLCMSFLFIPIAHYFYPESTGKINSVCIHRQSKHFKAGCLDKHVSTDTHTTSGQSIPR